ncbi:hypothetical protein Hanom_Chr03g00199161 [Helianthus anomalus]
MVVIPFCQSAVICDRWWLIKEAMVMKSTTCEGVRCGRCKYRFATCTGISRWIRAADKLVCLFTQ